MSELVAQTKFYEGLTTLFPFPLPQCRDSVDFSQCFKSFSLGSDETKNFIDRLVFARQQLIKSTFDGVPYSTRLAAVDQYLPLLHSLYQSWSSRASSSPPVRLDKEPVYEWRLYFHGRPELFRSAEMVFDLIMCYHWKVSDLYLH
jgi:hypothetical protein